MRHLHTPSTVYHLQILVAVQKNKNTISAWKFTHHRKMKEIFNSNDLTLKLLQLTSVRVGRKQLVKWVIYTIFGGDRWTKKWWFDEGYKTTLRINEFLVVETYKSTFWWVLLFYFCAWFSKEFSNTMIIDELDPNRCITRWNKTQILTMEMFRTNFENIHIQHFYSWFYRKIMESKGKICVFHLLVATWISKIGNIAAYFCYFVKVLHGRELKKLNFLIYS